MSFIEGVKRTLTQRAAEKKAGRVEKMYSSPRKIEGLRNPDSWREIGDRIQVTVGYENGKLFVDGGTKRTIWFGIVLNRYPHEEYIKDEKEDQLSPPNLIIGIRYPPNTEQEVQETINQVALEDNISQVRGYILKKGNLEKLPEIPSQFMPDINKIKMSLPKE
jgi:hypothetical protein